MPSPRPFDPSATNLPGYLRNDLLRIWRTYDGLVPEALLRAFIAAATGEAQPDRGPVTVVDGAERVFVYGTDPCNSKHLVFVSLANLEEWAPVNVAAEIAGTWGRFVELGGDPAASLRDELADSARYPDFDAYRAKIPAPKRPRTEAQWHAAYARLACPRTRGPLDDDPLLRDDLITWCDEGRVTWFDPNRLDDDDQPESIQRKFGYEFTDLLDNGPFVQYEACDEAAILAAFARLGYTVVRDDDLVSTFWGFEHDLDGVVRRLAALRQADRLLAAAWGAVGGGGDGEDGDEDED
jgi:hypothetical protein